MGVPDFIDVVHAVRESRTWDFRSKEGLCAYSHAVIVALHRVDPNIGHLKKTEAQNHCVDPQGRNCAVDVALYKPTGQIIDFIRSGGFGDPPPSNDVVWSVGPVGEYTAADWFAPVGGLDGPDEPSEPDTTTLEARIVQLEALEREMHGQIGILNQQIAKLDTRQYRGTARIFGLSITVTSDPVREP